MHGAAVRLARLAPKKGSASRAGPLTKERHSQMAAKGAGRIWSDRENSAMGLIDRRRLYQAIEAHRDHPLLVYVTSKREGVDRSMATDALPYLIDQLDGLAAETTELDFLIASYGGDPMVAWRIMSLIRERVDRVYVLVPQSAYSAATLLALGADEIVMHPNSHLGPVDMQITTVTEGRPRRFSTEDISAFLDLVREKLRITDQEHLRTLFEVTCKEVGTLGVGFTARSQTLAVALGERLLSMHMGDDDNGARNRNLIENLSRQFQHHSYPVSRSEAIDIGLAVNKERDIKLESLMWSVWLDLEDELQERKPFSPIIELLNSTQGDRLLSPVPQLQLPCNSPSPTYVQATMDEVKKGAEMVEPVDFEHVDAIMESPRLAYRGITRGKILASRLPDLEVQYNALVTFRGWEKRD